MPDPDPTTTGLDRETHLCVMIPGIVLLVAGLAAALVIPGVPAGVGKLWSQLKGIPAESLVAGLVVSAGGGTSALALGLLNRWVARALFDRLPLRRSAFRWRGLAEVLPYWALQPAYRSSFYRELELCLKHALGDIDDLSVWEPRGQGTRTCRRFGEDVAADLINAWLLAQGPARCEPGMAEVRLWRERSNFSMALSTALPLSLFALCAAAMVRLIMTHSFRAPWLLLPVAAVAAAGFVHRWAVFRAVASWVNGQNLLCRLFWAAYRGRITVSSNGQPRETVEQGTEP